MWIKKIGKGIFRFYLSFRLVTTAVMILAVAGLGIWAKTALNGTVDEGLLLSGDRTTRLYYYDDLGKENELVQDRLSGYENALWCPLEEMSPHLINAFISIEDKRFYEHAGIDWLRTGSAVLQYVRGGDKSFGGSTITQQLVKNLTGDSERSVRRKIEELLRAVDLEKKLSKNEILEQYLNVVNLAQSCYGVRTAANVYFSKEPAALDAREAATIAAITNNPARFDPIRHPEKNRTRRDVILKEMRAQARIDEASYLRAYSGETQLLVNHQALSGRVNSWYADMVVNDVIAALMAQKGMSEAAASRMVYCGGLRIYTAVSPALQKIVSDYYENEENFPLHEGGTRAQSALLLVDPHTGDILAVAGAVGKKDSNRVQSFATDSKRPSGSVIKPLSVYAPALARNLITYGTVFDDIPQEFKENGAPWPRNAPNIYRGLTTVNTAVKHSVNTVCVEVLQKLGARNSYRFLRDKLGFYSLSEQNDLGAAALALGQQHTGVTLREIVGGYTALANGGVYAGTRSFYRVLDSKGEEILVNGEMQQKAIERADAAVLTMMLRGAVQEGTGRALTLKNIVDVAGKTGTTGKNCDKWFVGYTPELLCGVWYGHEYPAPLNDVKGNPALRIFDTVMHRVLEEQPAQKRQFETPEDVVVVRYCKDSGKLPCEACLLDPRGNRLEYGYFKKGTEPVQKCDRHVCVDYCDHGGVASEGCPAECRHQTALLRVKRSFPYKIAVEDAPYTYDGAVGKMERNFTYDEPYYAVKYNSKQNFGVGKDVIPYNHACPVHTADAFWRRRTNVG